MDSKTNITAEPTTLVVNSDKKMYEAPRLQTYGQLHTFTQGSGGQANDGALGMTMMVV